MNLLNLPEAPKTRGELLKELCGQGDKTLEETREIYRISKLGGSIDIQIKASNCLSELLLIKLEHGETIEDAKKVYKWSPGYSKSEKKALEEWDRRSMGALGDIKKIKNITKRLQAIEELYYRSAMFSKSGQMILEEWERIE
ncbi:MAG: hypothetical protein KAI16_01645 [Candidatus Pacebacteria bacterium]|nr:hypothetical protein [Candidatus Paceibacterota bacterium]